MGASCSVLLRGMRWSSDVVLEPSGYLNCPTCSSTQGAPETAGHHGSIERLVIHTVVETSAMLFEVVPFDLPQDFRQRRPDGCGRVDVQRPPGKRRCALPTQGWSVDAGEEFDASTRAKDADSLRALAELTATKSAEPFAA